MAKFVDQAQTQASFDAANRQMEENWERAQRVREMMRANEKARRK